jgi:nucleoside-triphosphatase
MTSKILITGPPRSGKTTLIKKLISHYAKSGYKIEGFITPEKLSKQKRIGFDLLNIKTNESIPLARVRNLKTKYKIGKYNVFIENLENFILSFGDMKNWKIDLVIIDEIGKMELFSNLFQDFIKKLFNSEILLIASIGQKLQHPLKIYIEMIPGVKIMKLNRLNHKEVFKKITSMI